MRRKSKGGRPTKIDALVEVPMGNGKTRTLTIADAIVEEVATGVPQDSAAAGFGISRSTLYDWKKQGRRKPQSVYGRFRTALRAAQAKAHNRLAKAFYIQAMKNPSAAQFWFTRREPQTWAEPQQRVQLSGKKGQPIETHDTVAAGLLAKLQRMAKGGEGEK